MLPFNTNTLRPGVVVVDDALVSGYCRSVTVAFITWSNDSLPGVMGSLPGVMESLPGVMGHYLE